MPVHHGLIAIMKRAILVAILAASCIAIPTFPNARDTSACPFYLPEGSYEFPHLIVPIDNSNIAHGHSYFATVTPNNYATIFNFDIPQSRANQQCSVYFTFPRHGQLTTSDYHWNGSNSSAEAPGSLQLVQYTYNTGATETTTGYSQPPFVPDPLIDLTGVIPGNSYKVWTGSCGSGGVMSWRLSSCDSILNYFQDWNLCAIGLWVVYEAVPALPGPQCANCPDMSKFQSHAAWLEAYAMDANAW